MTSPMHLSMEDLAYRCYKTQRAHRMRWMAFDDGLLPLDGCGEDGRTNGRILVDHPCKKMI
jgi:hypothetical protein